MEPYPRLNHCSSSKLTILPYMSEKNLHELPCRSYIASTIKGRDTLCRDFFGHLPFIAYWSICIKNSPTATNAMLFAFSFFDKNHNEEIDSHIELIANRYLERLISYYDTTNDKKLNGKSIARFIRAFKSFNGREEILTNNIDWAPKDLNPSEEELKIACEFDFAWNCARLWQYLSPDRQEFMLHFLHITDLDFENLLKNETNHDSFEGINNFDIEDPEYFKKNLEFYSPYQMSEQEMKMLLKKACLASIKEKDKDGKIIDIAASNARIKHLEPLWTLGRFYGIHNYALDFIGRPMPSQAVMQFSGIVDSPFLSCDVKDLDVLIKSRTIRIGHHNYPLEDALIALYDNSKLLSLLDAKSNEIIPGKIQNIYKPILENVQKKYPKHSLVATLDYSGDKLRNLARKYPGFLKALIFFSSIPDFFLKYKTEIEKSYST